AATQGITNASRTANAILSRLRMRPPFESVISAATSQNLLYRRGITVALRAGRVQYIFVLAHIRTWYRLPDHGLPTSARVHRRRRRIERHEGGSATAHLAAAPQ